MFAAHASDSGLHLRLSFWQNNFLTACRVAFLLRSPQLKDSTEAWISGGECSVHG